MTDSGSDNLRGELTSLMMREQHAPMSTHDPRNGECVQCPWPLYELGVPDIVDALLPLVERRVAEAEAVILAIVEATSGTYVADMDMVRGVCKALEMPVIAEVKAKWEARVAEAKAGQREADARIADAEEAKWGFQIRYPRVAAKRIAGNIRTAAIETGESHD